MEMMSVREFTQTLPSLLAGKQQYSALFSTYREVAESANGYGPTGKPGLEVTIRTGGLAAYTIEPRLGPRAEVRAMELQATLAQLAVEQVAGDIAAQKYDLVVVYLGLTAFEPALRFVRLLRRALPKARLVTLTCDCNVREKSERLAKPFADNTIDFAVVTPRCGGEEDMRDLVDALVTAWPAEKRH